MRSSARSWGARAAPSTNGLATLITSTGKLAQGLQRRVAGAEVVEGDLDAEVAQCVQCSARHHDIGEEHRSR